MKVESSPKRIWRKLVEPWENKSLGCPRLTTSDQHGNDSQIRKPKLFAQRDAL